MGQQSQVAPWVVLFILLIVLQGAMVAVDSRQGPGRVAEEFAKTYYYIDDDMADYVCSDLADSSAVGDYLYSKRHEARLRGLPVSYLRFMFTEMHLETIAQDDATATIHLKGKTRRAINPVYMLVGKLFFISEPQTVETTLELIKEDDGWKVCGQPFGLASDI